MGSGWLSKKMKISWSAYDTFEANFKPLVVIELAQNTKDETKEWLMQKVVGKKKNGGSNMQPRAWKI
ncbi:hypothetical protein E2320_002048 [Naja naja]|nr:hypothetical protein E2320_002048 [Naja naja]